MTMPFKVNIHSYKGKFTQPVLTYPDYPFHQKIRMYNIDSHSGQYLTIIK